MKKVRIYRDHVVDGARLPSGHTITVEDAAVVLGVSDETVRRAISNGSIHAEREDGTHGRFGWRWVLATDEVNRVKKLSSTVTRVVLP